MLTALLSSLHRSFRPQTVSFSKRNLAIVALIAAAAGYATLGIVARILSQGFEPMTQVHVRLSVGFLISLILFRNHLNFKKLVAIPKKDVLWLVVMGTLGYSIAVFFVTQAALQTKLVNVAVIDSTLPFMVYVYSYFLLKEKVRPKFIGLLAVAAYGVSIVASQSFIPQLDQFGIGELYAVLFVVAGSWWSVGRKMLSSYLNNKEITVVVMGIAALSGITIGLLKGESLPINSFFDQVVLFGIALGAVLNVIITFAENFAFQHIDVVFGNQLLMLTTVFAVVYGFVFYQELIALPELVGGVLILTSVWFAKKLLKM